MSTNISGQGEVYRTSYGADNLTAETSFSFGDQFNATTMGESKPVVGSPLNGLVMTLLVEASQPSDKHLKLVDSN